MSNLSYNVREGFANCQRVINIEYTSGHGLSTDVSQVCYVVKRDMDKGHAPNTNI